MTFYVSLFFKKKNSKTERLAVASLKTSKNYSCNPACYYVAATIHFMVSEGTFIQYKRDDGTENYSFYDSIHHFRSSTNFTGFYKFFETNLTVLQFSLGFLWGFFVCFILPVFLFSYFFPNFNEKRALLNPRLVQSWTEK